MEETSHFHRHPTYLRIPSTPNSHTSREYSNGQDYIAVDTIHLSEEGDEPESSSPLLTSYNRFPRGQKLHIPSVNALNLSYSLSSAPISLTQKLTNFEFASALRSLSIAACALVTIPTGLPTSLQVLNLAENRLKSIENLDSLRHLHLLNLSYNKLESLSGLYRLKDLFELYVAGNCISKVTKVFQLQNLAIMDLSKNRIGTMEGIIDLAQNRHLLVLRLTGNPLYKKMYFEPQVHSVLPQVKYLDPPHILDHSAYRQLSEEAFGKILLNKPVEKPDSDLLELTPTVHKCVHRLHSLGMDTERKALRMSLNFSTGVSQSVRSSTVRIY